MARAPHHSHSFNPWARVCSRVCSQLFLNIQRYGMSEIENLLSQVSMQPRHPKTGSSKVPSGQWYPRVGAETALSPLNRVLPPVRPGAHPLAVPWGPVAVSQSSGGTRISPITLFPHDKCPSTPNPNNPMKFVGFPFFYYQTIPISPPKQI